MLTPIRSLRDPVAISEADKLAELLDVITQKTNQLTAIYGAITDLAMTSPDISARVHSLRTVADDYSDQIKALRERATSKLDRL